MNISPTQLPVLFCVVLRPCENKCYLMIHTFRLTLLKKGKFQRFFGGEGVVLKQWWIIFSLSQYSPYPWKFSIWKRDVLRTCSIVYDLLFLILCIYMRTRSHVNSPQVCQWPHRSAQLWILYNSRCRQLGVAWCGSWELKLWKSSELSEPLRCLSGHEEKLFIFSVSLV